MVDKVTRMRIENDGTDSLYETNERFSDELITSTQERNEEIKRQMNKGLPTDEESLVTAWRELNKKTRIFS